MSKPSSTLPALPSGRGRTPVGKATMKQIAGDNGNKILTSTTNQINPDGEPVKTTNVVINKTEVSDIMTYSILYEKLPDKLENSPLTIKLKNDPARDSLDKTLKVVIQLLHLGSDRKNYINSETGNIEFDLVNLRRYQNYFDGYECYNIEDGSRGTFINYTQENIGCPERWNDKNIMRLIQLGAKVSVSNEYDDDDVLKKEDFFDAKGKPLEEPKKGDKDFDEKMIRYNLYEGIKNGTRSFFYLSFSPDEEVINWLLNLIKALNEDDIIPPDDSVSVTKEGKSLDETRLMETCDGTGEGGDNIPTVSTKEFKRKTTTIKDDPPAGKRKNTVNINKIAKAFAPRVGRKYSSDFYLNLTGKVGISNYGTGILSSRVPGGFSEGYLPIKDINSILNLVIGKDNFLFICSNILKVDLSDIASGKNEYIELIQDDKVRNRVKGTLPVFKYKKNDKGKPIYIIKGVYLDKLGNFSIGQVVTTVNWANDVQDNNVAMSLIQRMLGVRKFTAFKSMSKEEYAKAIADKASMSRAIALMAPKVFYPIITNSLEPARRPPDVESIEEEPKKMMIEGKDVKESIEEIQKLLLPAPGTNEAQKESKEEERVLITKTKP